MTLSPAQQTALFNHLRAVNRLSNEDLLIELTDHYTNALTEQMEQGKSFQDVLSTTDSGFGGRSGLQKMERQYNRITFRRYDKQWLTFIKEQGRWPSLLVPVFVYILVYWVVTHIDRPTPFSLSVILSNAWGGFLLGSIGGLIITFVGLILRNGITDRNLSHKAIYLITRFLPITIFLYGAIVLLVYLNVYFPPFVYESILAYFATATLTYMLSYSRFYQAVLKK